MRINPVEIRGNWDKGYVLDNHMTPNESRRTELGALLYKLKYGGHYESVHDIVRLIKPFLDSFHEDYNIGWIIPAPPSKLRIIQPVEELAAVISEYLQVGFSSDILEKVSAVQVKHTSKTAKMRSLKGSVIANKHVNEACNILLIDDLYETGKTLTECVSVLKDDPLIENIYVLAMTKAGVGGKGLGGKGKGLKR